jgi:hypothetical protein
MSSGLIFGTRHKTYTSVDSSRSRYNSTAIELVCPQRKNPSTYRGHGDGYFHRHHTQLSRSLDRRTRYRLTFDRVKHLPHKLVRHSDRSDGTAGLSASSFSHMGGLLNAPRLCRRPYFVMIRQPRHRFCRPPAIIPLEHSVPSSPRPTPKAIQLVARETLVRPMRSADLIQHMIFGSLGSVGTFIRATGRDEDVVLY